jgi:hypothetical protein
MKGKDNFAYTVHNFLKGQNERSKRRAKNGFRIHSIPRTKSVVFETHDAKKKTEKNTFDKMISFKVHLHKMVYVSAV